MVESLIELFLVVMIMTVVMGAILGVAVKVEKTQKSRKSKIGANTYSYRDEDGIWRTVVEGQEEDADECEEDDC